MHGGSTARTMRLKKREVRSEQEIRSIVKRCHTMRLGLHDEQGVFIVPVNFGYEWGRAEGASDTAGVPGGALHGVPVGAQASVQGGTQEFDGIPPANLLQLTLWFHGATEGRKFDALQHNQHVAFEMDIEGGVIGGSYSCTYSFAYESIMGMGVVRRAETTEHKQGGLMRIMNHLAPGQTVEFSEAALQRTAVFAMEVTQISAKRRQAK